MLTVTSGRQELRITEHGTGDVLIVCGVRSRQLTPQELWYNGSRNSVRKLCNAITNGANRTYVLRRVLVRTSRSIMGLRRLDPQ